MADKSNGYSKRWAELLEDAVNIPGKVHDCYGVFHGYSLANQFLAYIQCDARDIQPGPIAPLKKWNSLGRKVRKGEKAIYLYMPCTFKEKEKDEDGNEVETGRVVTYFKLLPRWFVYAQTEGDEIDWPKVQQEVGEWNLQEALKGLDIAQVNYDLADGNVQGYASKRTFAVNPMAARPFKTAMHEIAHIALGHTTEGPMIVDEHRLTRNIREVEAEAVTMLVLDALALEAEGQVYSRGYIQNWLGSETIGESSARRIFGAADKILKAGRGQLADYQMKEAA